MTLNTKSSPKAKTSKSDSLPTVESTVEPLAVKGRIEAKGKAKAKGKPEAKSKTEAKVMPEAQSKTEAKDEPEVNDNESPPSPKSSPKKRVRDDELSKEQTNKKSKSSPANPVPEHQDHGSEDKAAATNIDKTTWKGFCEIESDAALFSVMLRDMGVNGITVKEVFFAEPEELQKTLPLPIHGLVLCYRYREFDNENQEKDCPESIWFANQLPAQNSCATLALINILMNSPNVSLGDSLNEFQKSTLDLIPFQRGEAFANFDFVKKIHNSFAKKMDMQLADTILARKVNKGFKSRRDSDSTTSSSDSLEENAHHFIAFLPIDGEVWKLDGMDHYPTSMGDFDVRGDHDWLGIACERIQTLMTAAADDDYTILAVCQSPAAGLRQELCTNAGTCKLVEACLDLASREWRSFIAESEALTTPSLFSSLGVGDAQQRQATVPADTRKEIESMDVERLLEQRGLLVQQQGVLVDSIFSQLGEEEEEEAKAAERRWDYGPAIQLWMEKLAEIGYLEKNLERFK